MNINKTGNITLSIPLYKNGSHSRLTSVPFKSVSARKNHTENPFLFKYIVFNYCSNEFEPRLKSAINRFQLSASLNLETVNKYNLNETNHI